MAAEIACPFVYANGRKCSGHITRVEAYKCDVTWTPDADGRWRPSVNEVGSHYHLFCSEKGESRRITPFRQYSDEALSESAS